MSLDSALEQRRSVRTWSRRSLELQELSTLLYHSARVTEDGRGAEARRPFASAGGRSELELYVVANNVRGLARSAYRYDGRAHQLVFAREDEENQRRVNSWVRSCLGGVEDDPQVVLLVTAVFPRLLSKYWGLGLTLLYQNVGALLQNMYLVSTALGLGPCAVGRSQELENAAWLGLDPLVESQVGCVTVGTRR